jgi:hypothetical protein
MSPSGSIHSARTGRKLKTLAITRKIPTGILIQQDEDFRAIETLDPKTLVDFSAGQTVDQAFAGLCRSSLCTLVQVRPEKLIVPVLRPVRWAWHLIADSFMRWTRSVGGFHHDFTC